MAQRELPKGIRTYFRLALQYWFSLSDRERLASIMRPDVALDRLAQLDGNRPESEYCRPPDSNIVARATVQSFISSKKGQRT